MLNCRGALASVKESLRRFLVPTTAELYKRDDHAYRAEHAPIIRALIEDLQTVENALKSVREERSTILQNIGHMLQAPKTILPSPWHYSPPTSRQSSLSSGMPESTFGLNTIVAAPSSQEGHFSELYANIQETRLLRSYAEELDKSIDDYQHLVNTQATADRTGYRELRDWAKDMLDRYEYLGTVLMTISTVGSGLVYATIFSATRGNIGLMCIAFPLFTVGFIIPITAQISLRMASSLKRPVPFASQRFWKGVIAIFMCFAVLSIFTAVIVLNVTIFFLDHTPPPAELIAGTIPASSGMVGDKTFFVKASSLPGIVALAFTGSVFLVLVCAFAMAACVRGRQENDLGTSSWRGGIAVAKRAKGGLGDFKHI